MTLDEIRAKAAEQRAGKTSPEAAPSPAQGGSSLDVIRARAAEQRAAQKVKTVAEENPSGLMNAMNAVIGAPQAVASVASSAFAEPIAGLAGLASLPLGVEQANKNIEATRNALTFTPESPAGQAAMGVIGSAVEPFANTLQSISSGLGDAAFEATGSPAVAAAFYAAPDAALSLLGVGAGKTGISAAAKAKNAKDLDIAEELADPIKRTTTEKAARHTVNSKGEVITDHTATRLIERDGILPAEVALMNKSNQNTRLVMKQMKDSRKN